jgi:hypothetical protein
MNPLKSLVVVSLVASVSVASAAISDIQVTVAKDPGGAVAYKGKVDAKGNFATAELPPGSYAVVFTSKAPDLKSEQLSLRVTGGKQKMAADGVEGAKLAGRRRRHEDRSGKGIAPEWQHHQRQGGELAGREQGNTKVKIVNGKRYYWMRPETGSNMGGRWVEESEISPSKVQTLSKDTVREMQNRSLVQPDDR